MCTKKSGGDEVELKLEEVRMKAVEDFKFQLVRRGGGKNPSGVLTNRLDARRRHVFALTIEYLLCYVLYDS